MNVTLWFEGSSSITGAAGWALSKLPWLTTFCWSGVFLDILKKELGEKSRTWKFLLTLSKYYRNIIEPPKYLLQVCSPTIFCLLQNRKRLQFIFICSSTKMVVKLLNLKSAKQNSGLEALDTLWQPVATWRSVAVVVCLVPYQISVGQAWFRCLLDAIAGTGCGAPDH